MKGRVNQNKKYYLTKNVTYPQLCQITGIQNFGTVYSFYKQRYLYLQQYFLPTE